MIENSWWGFWWSPHQRGKDAAGPLRVTLGRTSWEDGRKQSQPVCGQTLLSYVATVRVLNLTLSLCLSVLNCKMEMTAPASKGAYVFKWANTSTMLRPALTLTEDLLILCYSFPGGSEGKESACNAEDPGSIPGLGRSPGQGNCNPRQYSCLENSMDRGAWETTVHGCAKSQTRLSD